MKKMLVAGAVVALALFSGGEANAFLAGKNTPGQPQGAYTPQNSWSPHHGGRGDICESCHYNPPHSDHQKGIRAGYDSNGMARGNGGGYCGGCGPAPTQQQTRY